MIYLFDCTYCRMTYEPTRNAHQAWRQNSLFLTAFFMKVTAKLTIFATTFIAPKKWRQNAPILLSNRSPQASKWRQNGLILPSTIKQTNSAIWRKRTLHYRQNREIVHWERVFVWLLILVTIGNARRESAFTVSRRKMESWRKEIGSSAEKLSKPSGCLSFRAAVIRFHSIFLLQKGMSRFPQFC